MILIIGIVAVVVILIRLVAWVYNRKVRLQPEDMEYINKDGSLRP